MFIFVASQVDCNIRTMNASLIHQRIRVQVVFASPADHSYHLIIDIMKLFTVEQLFFFWQRAALRVAHTSHPISEKIFYNQEVSWPTSVFHF